MEQQEDEVRRTTRAIVTACALSAAVLVASCGDGADTATPQGPPDRSAGATGSRTAGPAAGLVPGGRAADPRAPARPDASDSVFGSPTDLFGG
ncbi:hypothetical protein SZN_23851 [Streptomyces zinciresistens K42]|uniref:Uncharacterized protein n=1 Tax=Streptomyces zinciresistens K42 TaxID=700597 RepID=G2GGY6_9ACTN|nr:hypothetical protein [Streptomyces zinciresistens]EGX57234.1 hypothetical protein SZN_23851 [Streptomyces zinciresistens K42]